MFIVITGNVDPDETIKLIENHENKRETKNNNVIRLEEFEEPNEVFKKEETLKMDVTLPKVAIAYKINVTKSNMDMNKIYSYLLNCIDLKIGTTSLFTEKLRNEGLITDTFDVSGIKANDHLILMIDCETNYPDEVLEKLKNELKDLTISEKEFERRKKTGISSLYFMSDNIYKINSKIVSDIMERGEIDYDPINTIRNYKYSKLNELLKTINLDNYSIIKVLPEN
jgi:predicted Zn-dependent peptidase